MENGIYIGDGVRVVLGGRPIRTVSAYYKDTGSATRDLDRRGAVTVIVVPKRARGMVFRDIDFVLKLCLRLNIQQDVVAVPYWRNVQAVGVQVHGVETSHSWR